MGGLKSMRFQKDRFLKKVTALSAISILLMSFAAIQLDGNTNRERSSKR